MNSTASERRPLTAPTVFFLVAVAGLCWAVTVDRMRGMNMGPGMDLGGLGWFAAVWLTMMAAMMLPSLTPMAVASSRAAGGQLSAIARSAAFAAGYLLAWLAFGVLAYALVQGVRSLDDQVNCRVGRRHTGGRWWRGSWSPSWGHYCFPEPRNRSGP